MAKRKSCMYFDFKIPGEENRTIAIDVYFYDDNGNRNSEDCYAFDLFIRPTHYDAINDEERKLFADKCFTQNESLFSSIIPEYSELFKKNDNGRLKSQVLYSKYNLKNILTKILSDISSYYKKQKYFHHSGFRFAQGSVYIPNVQIYMKTKFTYSTLHESNNFKIWHIK